MATVLVLFWRLGEPTFWDPDEGHYAVTTRELVNSGDWLAPTYNGVPFFDKPVFFHHLQAIGMLAFGQNELGARSVSAVAGLGLVLVVGWLGWMVAGAEVGWSAAALVAVCPATVALARYAILDLPFTFFLFGGVSALAIVALQERSPRLEWIGYGGIAAAVLIKGPLALALTGLTFVVALGISPALRVALLRLRWGQGLLLILAIALPWYAYMLWRFGATFVQGYFLDENVLLFAKATYANQPHWSFYLQIVAVGMMPWTPVLLGRLWDLSTAAMRGVPRHDPFETLLWVWSGTVLAFFTLSQFKLDHYIFPIAPALCLLIARSWRDARGSTERGAHEGVYLGLSVVGPLLMVGGLVLAYLLWVRFDLPPMTWGLPLSWMAGGAYLTWSNASARRNHAPDVVVGAFVFAYVLLLVGVVPQLEAQKVVAALTRDAVGTVESDVALCGYRMDRWNNSLLFYATRPVTLTTAAERVADLAHERGALCVTTRDGLQDLMTHGLTAEVLHERQGAWATSGRTLWRSRSRQTTFVAAMVHPASSQGAGSLSRGSRE